MIEKKTVIDQIEVARSGNIGVRFGLLVIEDGVEIACRWHRMMLEPGADVDAAIALVNADIASRPELRAPAVEADRLPLLKSIAALAPVAIVASVPVAAVEAVVEPIDPEEPLVRPSIAKAIAKRNAVKRGK